MSPIFWLFLVLGLLLALGLGLSFYLTHRFGLSEVHSPAEYGLQFEAVSFRTADGLLLAGWWIPATASDRAVVILHGHGGSMDFDVQRAPALREAGFNVLLFDFRAHGRSQGRVATFGCLERRDVQAAVEFLKSRGMRRIGLLGFSYGGMIAMLSAPICLEIGAVITDGGPSRLRTAFKARAMELHFPSPFSAFLAWLTIVLTSLRLGVNLFAYEPVRWVGKISPRPILFIHGDQDRYCIDFDELFAAAGEPKELWRLPEVGHTLAGSVYPEEHRRRVIDFFLRHL